MLSAVVSAELFTLIENSSDDLNKMGAVSQRSTLSTTGEGPRLSMVAGQHRHQRRQTATDIQHQSRLKQSMAAAQPALAHKARPAGSEPLRPYTSGA
mmetsp:Transcript_15417/g.46541  ORF Transcript_15417/g.46541 Transcript_15417/m.46541 type:complete len:97 (+) Transcript_15417:72-362(+)